MRRILEINGSSSSCSTYQTCSCSSCVSQSLRPLKLLVPLDELATSCSASDELVTSCLHSTHPITNYISADQPISSSHHSTMIGASDNILEAVKNSFISLKALCKTYLILRCVWYETDFFTPIINAGYLD